jgi:ATP:corrinoid adenosyltransferase
MTQMTGWRCTPPKLIHAAEQAAEIRELRKRNDAANERAQNGLDIGVIVVLFM